MKAKDLRPGQLFRVEPPDPECPVRVCLANDFRHGIRFGWPDNDGYWAWVGEEVEVIPVKHFVRYKQ